MYMLKRRGVHLRAYSHGAIAIAKATCNVLWSLPSLHENGVTEINGTHFLGCHNRKRNRCVWMKHNITLERFTWRKHVGNIEQTTSIGLQVLFKHEEKKDTGLTKLKHVHSRNVDGKLVFDHEHLKTLNKYRLEREHKEVEHQIKTIST